MSRSLAGYELGRLVHRTRSSSVYHATRNVDGLPVVAKFYTPNQSDEELRYRHEYELLRQLDVEGVTRAVELARSGPFHVLVLVRFEGVDLRELCGGRVLELERFAKIALSITTILDRVHRHGVVHRDIKPTSILADPKSLELCLVDFGLSLALERSHREIYEPGMIRGTLPYLAPEQSGRIARPVDHRSDLYGLGATFYELLAGAPPFVADDPLALVHAHLARIPTPLDQVRGDVPAMLARIIDRLLAKDPVDRYQSAHGLLADLRRVASGLRSGIATGVSASFELGTDDRPEHLELPTRIYGREREATRLRAALERSSTRSRPELVLVSGPPGIGKTTLLETLQAPLLEHGGSFAAGKFEQYRAQVPLLGLRQILAALADVLLLEDEARVARWQTRFGDALGRLGSELTSVVPRLAPLLGVGGAEVDTDTEPAPGSAAEGRNRLLLAVARLLETLASPERPVVLFFDDLQWSDPGTIAVLEHLLSASEAAGLLLIGAFRDAELDPDHPLRELVDRRAAIEPIERIELGPLSSHAVAELVADTLQVDDARAAVLAHTMAGRTDNNPLLLRQLLILLEREGVLHRQAGSAAWTFELDALRSVGIPHDALGMVTAKMVHLDPALRELLAAATCVGNRFDLGSLAAAVEHDPVGLLRGLDRLVDLGLLAPTRAGFRFSHDRIEEAARGLLEPEDAGPYHARIGRHRVAQIPAAEQRERAFELVDHLNWTLQHERETEALVRLAELNEAAGFAAIRSGANTTASDYLVKGLQARARAERDSPHETLELRLGLARCFAMLGRHDDSTALFDQLGREFADDPRTFARVALVVFTVYGTANRTREVIDWGLTALAKYGHRLPRHPSKLRIGARLVRLRLAYRTSKRAQLATLPRCESPDDALVLQLLIELNSAAYLRNRMLSVALMAEAGIACLEVGRTPWSSVALALSSVMLYSVFGDAEASEDLNRVALDWNRSPDAPHPSYVAIAVYAHVRPWLSPLRETLEGLSIGRERALAAGKFAFGVLSRLHHSIASFMLGDSLPALRSTCEQAARRAAEIEFEPYGATAQSLAMVCDRLIEDRERIEPDQLASISESQPRALAVVLSLFGPLFMARPDELLELAALIEASVADDLFGTFHQPLYDFARAMAAAMSGRRSLFLATHRAFDRKTRHAHEHSFGHLRLLLDAEHERLTGDPERVLSCYVAAAEQAARHGYVQFEALTHERLAGFALSRDWTETGHDALKRACSLYELWGALAKVEALTREHPRLEQLAAHDPSEASASFARESSVMSSDGSSAHFDVASALKSARSIAQSHDHAEVVDRLLDGALEHAGAQRAALISARGGQLLVERDRCGAEPPAEDSGTAEALDEAAARLPVTLIRLVARTREAKLVADARLERGLDRDPYVREHATRGELRSLACIPVRGRGQLVGVLYLENKLVTGAFTTAHLAQLEHLASQAAISLESAALLDSLRTSEAKWRSLVAHAPDDIALLDRAGTIDFINRPVLGRPVPELVGRSVVELVAPGQREALRAAIERVFTTANYESLTLELDDVEAGTRWWTARLGPITGEQGVEAVTMISTDVSDQRLLEAQLRQAQKMEAIGTLASGVAHDFNNLLGIILGSAELARERLLETDEALAEILAASERATALTRQLLALSRKQILAPELVDLNTNVGAMSKLLERLLGATVTLETEYAAALGPVRVDPGQLEQVVLNLAVNARDAMPEGGTIWLRTQDLEVGPEHPLASELMSGPYALIAVSDTGTGMDAATRERIFDPFFTTKAAGKGTGLGLSTVHGIVRQSGGHIEVDSEPGEGTTFFVYLPIADAGEPEERHSSTSAGPEGSETVVLVEPDPSLRRLSAKMLGLYGYEVLAVEDGRAALDAVARDAELGAMISALVGDVELPGLSGPDLARRLAARSGRALAVLYTSVADEAELGADAPGPIAFLPKPFSRPALARRLRELLDEDP